MQMSTSCPRATTIGHIASDIKFHYSFTLHLQYVLQDIGDAPLEEIYHHRVRLQELDTLCLLGSHHKRFL